MCSIPLKFYENDIQNSNIVIKNTTVRSPLIDFNAVQKIDNANYMITKVEFLDSNGDWVEPSGRITTQFADDPYHPYGSYYWGSSSEYTLWMCSKKSPDYYVLRRGTLNIPNTTGKLGMRIYMCGKLVYQLTNFSESHVTRDFNVLLRLSSNARINVYMQEKTGVGN